MEEDKYKQDGVNIEAGDAFSSYAKSVAKHTYENSPYVRVVQLSKSGFRGPIGYVLKGLPHGCIETGVMDGIGTKVVLIDASESHLYAATNLVAMTAMDITRYGGLPLVFMNILDVRTLGEVGSKTFKKCMDIMFGLGQVAMKEKYVILNGETAELGNLVGSDNPNSQVAFNWGGTMLGVYHPQKMILGDTLASGQIIIALRDNFRSNGISSVRKALVGQYGDNWYENTEAFKDIKAAAKSSELYDRFLNDMHGWFNPQTFEPKIQMHLIVHLSGGAFESKLGGDILSKVGYSAELEDLFDPSGIMKKCAQWRGMNSKECYKTWNGGQGAVVVIDKKDEKYFLNMAEQYGIEAKVAGKITKKKKYNVAIKSKFGNEEMIYY